MFEILEFITRGAGARGLARPGSVVHAVPHMLSPLSVTTLKGGKGSVLRTVMGGILVVSGIPVIRTKWIAFVISGGVVVVGGTSFAG